MQHQPVPFRKNVGPTFPDRWSGFVHLSLEDPIFTGTVIEPPSGEHLVKDEAERIEIALRTDGRAADLFRAHVGGCAEDRPGPGEPGHFGIVEHGETEVEHLHAAFAGEHEVRRLEVPVEDASAPITVSTYASAVIWAPIAATQLTGRG